MALAGDHVQVLVGGYELTGDVNSVTFEDARSLLSATTFGDRTENFIAGRRMVKLTHGGYLNTTSAQSHPVLNGVAVDGSVSVLLGQNADPAVGDPTYSMAIRQEIYSVRPEVNQTIPFEASFTNRGLVGGWGVLLTPPITITNSTSGSNVDNNAATSNGGAAYLHIIQAAASDTYTVILEGSATGSFSGEQSTLATFTLDASARDSERQSISGTIPRYVRYNATRSGSAGDSVSLALSLVRF